MPVTLTPNKMKIKKPNSQEFIQFNTIASETSQELIAQLNARAQQITDNWYVNLVNKVNNLVKVSNIQPTDETNQIWILDNTITETDVPTITDLTNIIAPTFSTSKTYAKGDYVIYTTQIDGIQDSKLYKFTKKHNAGVWNNSQVTEIKIGEELINLKNNSGNSGINTDDAHIGQIPMVDNENDIQWQYPTKHYPPNSEDAVTRMGNIALSYILHQDEFVYGGIYSAIRDECKPDPESGKWQIACSIFAILLLYGISYENSAYQRGTGNNIFDPDFCTDYEMWNWFTTKWPDKTGDYQYKYSFDLGQWCYEHGYAFEPNEDLSNIKPGDLLFFKNVLSYEPVKGFMDIEHTAICAYWKNDQILKVWEVGSVPAIGEYLKSHLLAPDDDTIPHAQRKPKLVLAARFPFATKNTEYKNVSYYNGAAISGNGIIDYINWKTITPGKYYTFIGKIQFGEYELVNLQNQIANLQQLQIDEGETAERTAQIAQLQARLSEIQNKTNFWADNNVSIADAYPAVNHRNTMLASYVGAINKPEDDIYVMPFVPTSTEAINISLRFNPNYKLSVQARIDWYQIVEGIHFSKERISFDRRLDVIIPKRPGTGTSTENPAVYDFQQIIKNHQDNHFIYSFRGTFQPGITTVGTVQNMLRNTYWIPIISQAFYNDEDPQTGPIEGITAYLDFKTTGSACYLKVKNSTNEAIACDVYCIIPVYNY